MIYVWESENKMEILGEIYNTSIHPQIVNVNEKYGMDITINARPIVTIYPICWRRSHDIDIEVYLWNGHLTMLMKNMEWI